MDAFAGHSSKVRSTPALDVDDPMDLVCVHDEPGREPQQPDLVPRRKAHRLSLRQARAAAAILNVATEKPAL